MAYFQFTHIQTGIIQLYFIPSNPPVTLKMCQSVRIRAEVKVSVGYHHAHFFKSFPLFNMIREYYSIQIVASSVVIYVL